MLKLPPTIHTADFAEVPNLLNVQNRIRERYHANIVEGYTLKNVDNKQHFTFYAEINIDNDRLWSLFKSLFVGMPPEVSLIYGFKDSENPKYNIYKDKYELLNKLKQYELELTQDAFLEFGVVYHDNVFLEEIFVKPSKYIQYWGVDISRFSSIMNDYGIYEVSNLNFVDEFPLVTQALNLFKMDVISTFDILKEFESWSD